ncbi:MAG: hypothetical protein HY721_20735 [Planctomycetes bacterium]|nr:hypothetical protein [Planctomycetota bacterium]
MRRETDQRSFTDDELLRRVAAGEEGAFRAIMERWEREGLSAAVGRPGTTALATLALGAR